MLILGIVNVYTPTVFSYLYCKKAFYSKFMIKVLTSEAFDIEKAKF